MPNRKISELGLATSSLATDGLVIQRGGTNFRLEASNFSTDTADTGSLVTTSSITGTTITFTKGDLSTYTNEIISASHAGFAISASYAVTASHEVVYETSASYANRATSASHALRADEADQAISASYAVSASLAQLALEAVSSSYAISASHAEISDEAISSSYAITASHATSTAGTLANGTSVDAFSFDGSTDVTVDISTYSASVSTDRTALSASLTTTDQTISSSVATLSGSASDARNLIAGDLDTLSASFNERINDNDDDIAGLNTYTASLKDAISLSGPNVTLLGDLTVQGTQSIIHSTEVSIDDNILSLNGTGATNGGIEVNDPSGPLSGSLLWDGANNRWIAGQSGSESVVLVADGLGILSSSAQIAGDISGSSILPISTLSGSASDARNELVNDLTVTGSDGQTIRFEGTTQVANSVLYNSGSQVAIGNTSPKEGYALTVTDGADTRVRIGRTGLTPDRDYLEIRSSTATGSLVANNEWLLISASSTGGGGANIRLDAAGGATYNSNRQIKAVADPTAAQDAATKNYVDTLSGSASDARNVLSSDYIAADTVLSASLTTTDQAISSSVASLSGSASDARNALSGDFVLKTGDTMTGPLSMSGNNILFGNGGGMTSDAGAFIGTGPAGATIQVNGGFADAFNLVVRNPTNINDFLLSVTSSNGGGNTILGRDLLAGSNQLKEVADPTEAQDAATKNYVDVLSGSASTARNVLSSDYIAADTTLSGSASTARNLLATDYIAADTTLSGSASTARNALAAGLAPPISVVGAAWDSGTAAQTMNQGKWSFNLNSSRQVEESDATQATFNTTNNEWILKEGTWEISADLTKTASAITQTGFFHIRFNTTAGSFYNAGTAIDDSDVTFATTGNQKVIMRAILTVPASATRYVWANFGSGNAFSAKHQKMTVKRIA